MGRPTNNPVERWTRWHWGEKPTRVIEVDDPDMPRRLIEIGTLVGFRIKRDGPYVEWLVPKTHAKTAHVAFDMDHRFQRIHLVVPPALRKVTLRDLWVHGAPTRLLADVAEAVGAKHGTRDYPRVHVQVVGAAPAIIYATTKRGDGYSNYIHALGEDGGVQPMLAISADGRLWLAGGSYTCPYPGISQ
jgi:hypothetical protein